MRRLGRILAWTFGGLLALLIALASAVQLPPVRGLIRDRILAAVQGSLQGELQVRDVRWPTPEILELSDVKLFDRNGTRVAAFSTLIMHLRLSSLVARQVEVRSVEISDLYVDLADFGDRAGLLSVFAGEPKKEPEPTSAGDMSPLPIVVRSLCVVRGELRAAPSADQVFGVRRLDLCVRLRVAHSLQLALEKLQGEVSRNDAPLASLRLPDALPALGGGAELAKLHAGLSAQLDFASADEMAFDVLLHARGFSPGTLRALGVEDEVLRGALDLDVHAVQRARELRFRAELASAAGTLHARGELKEQRDLHVLLETAALSPAAVTNLSLDTLGFALDARAKLSDSEPLALNVTLPRGYYAQWALPKLSVQATRSSSGAIGLRSLSAEYGRAALRGSGELGADGSARLRAQLAVPELSEVAPLKAAEPELRGALRASVELRRSAGEVLDVKADLDLAQLEHPSARARHVRLTAALAGKPDAPTVRVEAQAEELASGERSIGQASLQLTGGPQRYEFTLSADGDVVRADGWAEHAGRAWDAGFSLTSALPKGALSLQVPKLRFVPNESLAVSELRAGFEGAQLMIDGQLDLQKTDNHLRFAASVPDIEHVARVLGVSGIPGRVELVGSLRGRLDRPEARVKLRYGQGVRFEGALAKVSVDVAADAAKGSSQLRLDAHAGKARVSGQLDTRWPRRLPLSDIAESARHELALQLQHVSLPALLDPTSPEPRRLVDGLVDGSIRASGNLKRLGFDVHIGSWLRAARDEHSVDVSLDTRYRDARLEFTATARDRRGQLFELKANAGLDLERQLREPQTPDQLLRAARWELSSELSERSVAELPMVQSLDIARELLGVRAALHAQLKHEPHAQPVGQFETKLHWKAANAPPALRKSAVSCSDGASGQLRVAGKWADKTLSLEAHAAASARAARKQAEESEERDNLYVAARMPLAFDELLTGAERSSGFAGVQLAATLRELELQRIPLVCDQASGLVSLNAKVVEPLTARADVSLQLHSRELRWHDSPPMRLSLDARSEAASLRVSGQLENGQGTLQLSGRLPVDVRADNPARLVGRTDPLELDLQLSRVSMAALLAFAPGVARVSGTTSGNAQVRGTIDAPDTRGSLSLEDVSLTLPRLGQRFSNVHMKVILDGQTLRLSEGRVRDLGGSASVAALITLRSLDAWRAEVNLNARNFPMRKSGVTMAHADADVRVTAEMTREHASANVSLDNVSIVLSSDGFGDVQSLEPHPEFSFVDARAGAGGPEPDEPQDPGTAPIPMTIHVQTKQPMWVRRDDFAAQMEAELVITVTEKAPLMKGRIRLLRGYISLLGQNFDIKRGEVVLSGAEEIDPQLDITAEHASPRGSRVRVQVRGFVTAPELSFYVNDKLATAGEALLAINSRGSSGGASPEDQVASAAIGMMTGLLSLGARREFGDWMPMLQIEQGDQTRVRVGVEADRLIPKFMRGFVRGAYVEGIVASGGNTSQSGAQSAQSTGAAATSSTASGTGVLLELMLPSDLVWAGQYGPGQAWSVDLDWRP